MATTTRKSTSGTKSPKTTGAKTAPRGSRTKAASGKSGTGSTAKRRTNSSAKGPTAKKSGGKRPIRREVTGCVFLVAALCTLVGYFSEDGWLVAWLPLLFKGMFGMGVYLVAAALAVAGWNLLVHYGKPVIMRTTCTLMIPLFAGSIWHMLFCRVDFSQAEGIMAMLRTLWMTGLTRDSGGILSGAIARGAMAVFGRTASVILFVIALLALILASFHVSLRMLVELWRNRERMDYCVEDYEDELAEREKRREEKARREEAIQRRKKMEEYDIPLDGDEPEEPKPAGREKRRGFFRKKSADQLTPADVVAAGMQPIQRQEDSDDDPIEIPFEEHDEEQREESRPEPCRIIPMPGTAFSEAVNGPEPDKQESLPEEPARPEPIPADRPQPDTFPDPGPMPAPEQETPAVQNPDGGIKKKMTSAQELENATAQVTAEIESKMAAEEETYAFPSIDLLNRSRQDNYIAAGAELQDNARRLADTLVSFGVDATAGEVVRGPAVTRYEFKLEHGVKLSKITNLTDDIALALGASGVRIAPIPEKLSVVGIEVPNKTVSPVLIRDVIDSRTFANHKSQVAFAVGRDISNHNIVGDIAKLPHVLIAGTTGSGKSVCTNSLIVSLLYKSSPEDVRFIMVDPKMVELAPYNGIPHLLIPVVTDPKKAAGALQWAVFEMMKRYKTFSQLGCKKLEEYNALALQRKQENEAAEKQAEAENAGSGEAPVKPELKPDIPHLPSVVVVIDELADLMLVAAKEVEESICRVAQMGRAAGVHLVIATQRPSADVITGLMKANIPSRIAFAVSSSLESRIILDTTGAEKLVGRGDMLYSPLGIGKPQRVQGCFISPEEIDRVVEFVKSRGEAQYDQTVIDSIEQSLQENDKKGGGAPAADPHDASEADELLDSAVEVILETGQASVSMLQRRLKLGYSRAARLVDQMEERGIVGPFEGSKPRQLLISRERWQEMKMRTGGAAEDEDTGMPKWNDNEHVIPWEDQ